MRSVDIVWIKDVDVWVAKEDGLAVEAGPSKDLCVHRTAEWAKALGHPVSVRIHGLLGEFEEERTYPRSADPAESAG